MISCAGSDRRWRARWPTAAGLLAVALLAACARGPQPLLPAGEITNPALGPQYAQWLVGPISRMATREEIEEYLTLRSDVDAAAFIEEFWMRRDPDPESPGNPPRQVFESRAREADRRFSEAGVLGRRTDRGAIYVLYGAPQEVTHETQPTLRDVPREVWTYSGDAPEGLDGRSPAPRYRFVRRGDLTVLDRGPEAPLSRPTSEPW